MKLSKNIQSAAYAILPLIGVIALFIFAVPFGISQISGVRDKISKASTVQNTLTQKLDLLTNISVSAVSETDALAIALPDSNPALVTLSQIKILASAGGLSTTGVKGGSEVKDKSGLLRVDITFDLRGSRDAIMSFLKGVENISPITVVTKLKLNESGGGSLANITVSSFWSPLPTKIPAVTDPERDLTADEKNTIAKVSALNPPIFTEVPASETSGRSDPFTP